MNPVRVRITFKVKNRGAAVPFHHQHLIAQILKGLVLNSGESQFQDYPYYSFSGIKGQTKVSRAGLHFNSNRVTVVISSPNRDFIDFLVTRIFDQSKIDFGSLTVIPEYADEELNVDLADSVKYISISPLVLLSASFNSDESKKFIEPGSDEFSDKIFDTTLQRMEQFGIQTEEIEGLHKFQIVPDLAYINKIRQSQKKFSRVYSIYHQDVKYEVRGYTFPFTLYAPQEVQEFLFTCGIGFYNNKGFGMLDIANSDPTKRVVSYQASDLISA